MNNLYINKWFLLVQAAENAARAAIEDFDAEDRDVRGTSFLSQRPTPPQQRPGFGPMKNW